MGNHENKKIHVVSIVNEIPECIEIEKNLNNFTSSLLEYIKDIGIN